MSSSRVAVISVLILAVFTAALFTPSLTSGQQNTAETKKEDAAPKDDNKKDESPKAEDSKSEQAGTDSKPDTAAEEMDVRWPLFVLAVGVTVVLGLIIGVKVNAFIALIAAAMVVSLMAPGDWSAKIGRVASAFGNSTGSIGIVIALAAVIGSCMLDSGAADRIVRAFLNLLGEKRSPIALMGSGFVLAVPVFFDTVFYLLVPLARSLYRSTQKHYLKYILAISAGGAITHTLVPPTPGPLMMASNLGFDVGIMIMVGAMVALPAAIAGLIFAGIADRRMNIPMRQVGNEPDPEPLKDSELPSLFMSLLPVILPVIMISTNTVLTTLADLERPAIFKAEDVKDWTQFRGAIAEQAAQADASPAARVMQSLSTGAQDLINKSGSLTDEEQTQLVEALNNEVLGNKEFYSEDAFLGVKISSTAKSLLGKDRVRMKKVDAERMNRLLLEAAYPSMIETHVWNTSKRNAANISALFGNANLALMISTVIALWLVVKQRGLSRDEMSKMVETALMSAGVIILITAGGGAFGAMLKVANVGDAIKSLFNISEGSGNAGTMFLVLGFAIALVLKIAQGSSTVAMITGSAMLASIASPEVLGYHPVYLATAIGAGSLVGSWMNDSGFWIFAKMGGLTEVEALKSWTVMLAILGIVSFIITVILSMVLPLA